MSAAATRTLAHLERAALDAMRISRERIQTDEAALWLNAEYARRHGATLAQIAAAAGVTPEAARERLRGVSRQASDV